MHFDRQISGRSPADHSSRSSDRNIPSIMSGEIIEVEIPEIMSSPPSPPPPPTEQKKHGGWKAIALILETETCQKLADIGILSNFTVFLLTVFNLSQVSTNNVLNILGIASCFLPLLGAYISDAVLGKYATIAVSSIFTLMGIVTMTLIPWIPKLYPPACPTQTSCVGPKAPQMAVLVLSLILLSIGSAGISPCIIPFGVDQFDSGKESGRKGTSSFFNWYYTTTTIVLIICSTVTIYLQTYVSWVVGFAVPTILMVIAMILFFAGTMMYIRVSPTGSIISSIAQAFVAAFKKCRLRVPAAGNGDDQLYYDPPQAEGSVSARLTLTNKYAFLNKAAMIQQGDLGLDGSRRKKWNISSIQTIEEMKLIFNIVPVWASGMIFFLGLGQASTFTIYQALKMNRRLSRRFEIPAGSLSVISMITLAIWVPFYDRILVPWLRNRTKIEGGITILQRIGIGLVFSILALVAAALVEPVRRGRELSVLWLTPQLVFMGFSDAFNVVGQMELYNKEFPESMRSLATAMIGISEAGANYLSIVLVNAINSTKPDWLTTEGRLEYFYYLMAGLGVLNLGYFLYVAPKYRYKSRVMVQN